MKYRGLIRVISCLALISFYLFSDSANASDPTIYNSLSRSRDALLAQRAHLQDAADDAKAKIDQLNRQLVTINAYLNDTNTALSDVENALARAQ